MISILITLIVLCVIFGVIWYVIQLLALPHPFGLILQLLVALVFVLILLDMLVGLPGWSPIWRR